jgi:hypothetical protein
MNYPQLVPDSLSEVDGRWQVEIAPGIYQYVNVEEARAIESAWVGIALTIGRHTGWRVVPDCDLGALG